MKKNPITAAVSRALKHRSADPLFIEGRHVRRFIFIREQVVNIPGGEFTRNQPIEVHAFSKDHAFARLKFHTAFSDWDFLHECEGEDFLGKLGETITLTVKDLREENILCLKQ